MTFILTPERIEAQAVAEGDRVVLRIRRGNQVFACDMPPQVAVAIANQLHQAARTAQQRTNTKNAR